MSINPSPEQSAIVSSLIGGYNIIVDALAGTGKTSTILDLAVEFRMIAPHKILQVTYNRKLRLEVREKCRLRGLDNLVVHNYHTLCLKYYFPGLVGYPESSHFTEISRGHVRPQPFDDFAVVVIDEAQDMTPAYFDFLKIFFRDLYYFRCSRGQTRSISLIFMGDYRQTIYGYKGADPNFLLKADDLLSQVNLGFRSLVWSRLSLNTSYRITNQIAQFLNGTIRMRTSLNISAVKDGPPVQYYQGSPYNSASNIATLIQRKIKGNEWKPGDIFVLANSLTDKSPIKKLENDLANYKIPIYYNSNDEINVTDEETHGKVTFLTFHKAKGLERRVVIVFGFDTSYFLYGDRTGDPSYCPNVFYVAMTRAKETLILVDGHGSNKIKMAPYFRHEKFHDLVRRGVLKPCTKYKLPIDDIKIRRDNLIHKTSVTKLCSHVSDSIGCEIDRLVSQIFVNISVSGTTSEMLPSKINRLTCRVEDVRVINGLNSRVEDAHTINGLNSRVEDVRVINRLDGDNSRVEDVRVINSYATLFYFAMRHNHDLHRILYDKLNKKKSDTINSRIKSELQGSPITASDYLLLGSLWYSYQERIVNNLDQLKPYDWLSNESLAHCADNLDRFIMEHCRPGNIQYENEIMREFVVHESEISISGRTDIEIEDSMIEIKCVEELIARHRYQILTYAVLDNMIFNEPQWLSESPKKQYYLFNLRNGQCQKLIYNRDVMMTVFSLLLKSKYNVDCSHGISTSCDVSNDTKESLLEKSCWIFISNSTVVYNVSWTERLSTIGSINLFIFESQKRWRKIFLNKVSCNWIKRNSSRYFGLSLIYSEA